MQIGDTLTVSKFSFQNKWCKGIYDIDFWYLPQLWKVIELVSTWVSVNSTWFVRNNSSVVYLVSIQISM